MNSMKKVKVIISSSKVNMPMMTVEEEAELEGCPNIHYHFLKTKHPGISMDSCPVMVLVVMIMEFMKA